MDIVTLVGNFVPAHIHKWMMRQSWEKRDEFLAGLLDKEEQEKQERLADLLGAQLELEVGAELFKDKLGKIEAQHYLDKCNNPTLAHLYQLEWTEPTLQELERRGFSVTLLRQWFDRSQYHRTERSPSSDPLRS